MGILDTVINQAGKQLQKKNKTGGKQDRILYQLPQNESELIDRRKEAEDLVNNKALVSTAATIVPIPGLDVGVDIKLMTDIIEQINQIYGLSHKQVNTYADDAKQKILFTAAKQGSDFIGKKLSKALVAVVFKTIAKREAAKQSRWVPVVGQGIAGAISYYMMKKMGQSHIEKCESVVREIMAK